MNITDALGSTIFSDLTTLSPKSILEFFVFIAILEFIGILFTYFRGVR